MGQIAYVNGRYLPHAAAMVHVEDRGFQFSDGIYEYIAFYNRTLLDGAAHMARLQRSLNELGIPMPVTPAALLIIMHQLVMRNSREHGGLYIQVTRGVARRDHPFPKRVKPSLVMTVCAPKSAKPPEIKNGVTVITHPDLRWHRRDIKSVSLLPNVLAKQEAVAHQAREAWLLEGETVTEGSVSNAYIVDAKGTIVTHPADRHILSGVTRDTVLKLAQAADIKVVERPFTLNDVKKAAEAFLTSTSANVLPVVKVDDLVIGDGKPGPVTRQLQELYAVYIHKHTGWR